MAATTRCNSQQIQPMILSIPQAFEGAPPDVSQIPSTFLMDCCPTKLSSLINQAAKQRQPLELPMAHYHTYSKDEMEAIQASYQHVGLTNLQKMSPWLGSSSPQSTFFDAPLPNDDIMHKCVLDFPHQEDCEDSTCQISDLSTRAESEVSEGPRDILLSNAPIAYRKLPTTLMIRNIPQMYTQKALALEWPNNGTYNFFYLPTSHTTPKGNKTFAFINFTSPQAAVAFKECWDKKRLSQFQARRTLNITCADVQGRDANMWQLRKGHNWRLKNKECQPLIFEHGVQIPFEEGMARLSVCMEQQRASQMQ